MNGISWGKGFFRLWCVASVIWIAIMIVTTFERSFYPIIPAQSITAVEPVDPASGDYIESGASSYNQKIASQAVTETFSMYPGWQLYRPTNITNEEHIKIAEKAMNQIQKTIDYATFEQRKKYLLSLSVISLVPPLLILLLGYIFRWVFMGFRKSSLF